ncbi:hypothetical protein BH20ACI1_BH20ACI1_17830 [soil metagenome]
MNQLEPRYEVTRKDLAKEKALKYGAWTAPVLLSVVPALILFIAGFLLGSTPPAAATFFFLSLISLIGGFVLGLVVTGGILYYRSNWLAKVRERIAVDGIKANEVEWFKNELTTTEKKSLKEIESKDLLLADAFRDTLAARLTATRILKSTKSEILLVKRRQNKLKYLKSENSKNLQEELKDDLENLNKIKTEAEEMRIEAETRVQMIEAASRRGGSFANTELALKKLSARSEQLPLALESAKMEQEIRREIEQELEESEN